MTAKRKVKLMYKKLLLGLLFLGSSAFAQDATLEEVKSTVPDKPLEAKANSENSKMGWNNKLDLGANISFGSSQDVVGQDNGETTTMGLNLKGKFDYLKDNYEVQNNLIVKESSTKTPSIPQYVKSADEFKYDVTYLYHLENYKWMGPYARFSLATTLFHGEDVRAEASTYKITKQDGSVETKSNLKKLALTDPFNPLTTKESAGLFMNFVDTETVKLTTRFGLGAIQVSADGQFVVNDDSATSEIEINEVKSYSQVGAEFGLNYDHKLDERSSIFFGVEVLTPFSKDDDEERTLFELSNIEANTGYTNKMYEWMSLKYEAKALMQPQIIDKFQIQHMLLLNFSYGVL